MLNPERIYNQFPPSSDTCGLSLSHERQGGGSPWANTDLSPRPVRIDRQEKEKATSEIVENTIFFSI